jgi:hypothetical protein
MEVPCLLDLVQTKTGLPTWMTAPANLETATKTREVVLAEPAFSQRSVRWIPWQDRNRGPSVPQTPSSATVQTIFQGTAAAPAVRNPNDVGRNAMFYSKEFLRRYFLLWYWAAYVVLKFMGFDFFVSVVIALICLSLACITFGLAKAIDESLKANSPKLMPGVQPPATYLKLSQPPAPPASGSWSPHVTLPLSPSSGGSDPFVGNLVLEIYHLKDCDWVARISDKNRVGFSASSEAISHGFKPCRICSPTA